MFRVQAASQDYHAKLVRCLWLQAGTNVPRAGNEDSRESTVFGRSTSSLVFYVIFTVLSHTSYLSVHISFLILTLDVLGHFYVQYCNGALVGLWYQEPPPIHALDFYYALSSEFPHLADFRLVFLLIPSTFPQRKPIRKKRVFHRDWNSRQSVSRDTGLTIFQSLIGAWWQHL